MANLRIGSEREPIGAGTISGLSRKGNNGAIDVIELRLAGATGLFILRMTDKEFAKVLQEVTDARSV